MGSNPHYIRYIKTQLFIRSFCLIAFLLIVVIIFKCYSVWRDDLKITILNIK